MDLNASQEHLSAVIYAQHFSNPNFGDRESLCISRDVKSPCPIWISQGETNFLWVCLLQFLQSFGTATWTYNVDDFVWSVGANANVSTCINIKAIRISYSANHHQPAKSTHKNFLHFYISFLR